MGNSSARPRTAEEREAAALSETQRREAEAERARQAEIERLRRVEEATARRVAEELQKHREKVLRDFLKFPYCLFALPILYNVVTLHQFPGGLALACGGLMRMTSANKKSDTAAGFCLFALGFETVGEILADFWPLGSVVLHLLGYAMELASLASLFVLLGS
jgi:hypothetical protein